MSIAALGAGVLSAYLSEVRTTWALVIPLALLAINLTALVATSTAFRRQKGLLVFHVMLIIIVLLIATGRLTYLRGTLELTQGELFNGELTSSEAGPLHRWHLKEVKFTHDGFDISYTPSKYVAGGVHRGDTSNRIRWLDENGKWHAEVIGDNNALVIRGYQFHTTTNQGFAPIFVWTPEGGFPITGSIHLPSYPAHQYKQYLEWTPPRSALQLWTQLQFDEVIIDPNKPSQFRLPKEHKIVIRQGDDRYELQPGDHVNLPGGVLMYQGLTSWMGYNVDNDWTISWLFAACGVAMASLAWHFWQKFAARPWQANEDKA